MREERTLRAEGRRTGEHQAHRRLLPRQPAIGAERVGGLPEAGVGLFDILQGVLCHLLFSAIGKA